MKNQLLFLKLQRLSFVLFSLLFVNKAAATTYTFHGAFDSRWSFSWNWSAPSYMPPNPLPAGDNIVITGACNIDQAVTCNGSINYSGNFPVTISSSLTVASGGSFTIANLTNNGTFTVNGSFVTNNAFTNNGALVVNSPISIPQTITNNGSLTISAAGILTVNTTGTSAGYLQNGAGRNIYNYGQLNLIQSSFYNNGQVFNYPGGLLNCSLSGSITNNSVITNSGSFDVGNGYNIINPGTINNLSGGVIKGDGVIFHNWIYNGNAGSVISPGSVNTGRLIITGTSSANILGNSTYLCDIRGTTSGVNCDLLTLNNIATLSGATLTVNWGSFIPSAGQSFLILTCGSRNGQFASVNIPSLPGVVFAVVYNSNSVVIQATAVLPLHLIHFSGSRAQNNHVNLFWQTADEVNVAGYEIQISEDGINFSKNGFIASKNSNSTENYNYTLLQTNNRTYYRLKMCDKDGKFTYSNIIAIENSNKKQFYLFPNPSSDFINVSGILPNGLITITNMNSIQLLQINSKGNNETIDIRKLNVGTYIITYKHKNETHQLKFIKQ